MQRPVLLAAFLVCVLSPWGKLSAQQAEISSTTDASVDADSAQATSGTGLPSAPAPQSASQDAAAPQTKRILGIIPNFRAISTDQKLPPQTVKEKFVTATEDSFDYSAIFIPALLAGYWATAAISGIPLWTRPAKTTWWSLWFPPSRMKTRATTRWGGAGF
jgi:hypothetical protein